jgi:hypothetical protein
MTMTKHATFSAIVLIGLLTAACTSTPGTTLRSASISGPSGPAVATTAPGPEALTTPQPGAAPTQRQPLAPQPAAPNRCPPFIANPVGCPGPWPPQPIVPQAGHARILLCLQPIVATALPRVNGAIVCGVGFRPEELVTITVSGRMGSNSWQVAARPDGTFRSGLPPAACRLMPAYVTARGNHGSVSNAVLLTILACRPIP